MSVSQLKLVDKSNIFLKLLKHGNYSNWLQKFCVELSFLAKIISIPEIYNNHYNLTKSHISDLRWPLIAVYWFVRSLTPALKTENKEIFHSRNGLKWARKLFTFTKFRSKFIPRGWALYIKLRVIRNTCSWSGYNNRQYCFLLFLAVIFP